MTFRLFTEDNKINNQLTHKIDNLKLAPYNSDIQSFISLTNYMNSIENNLEIIELKQTDFMSGTYRIKTSGYYKLVEDIVFNPNPSV